MQKEKRNKGKAIVITFGISKGGCSKTTSCGITAHLLSKKHKVLAIDMDGQGNLTQFLTSEDELCDVFEERTILEAMKERNIKKYIVKVNEDLHVVPSNDYLALFARYLYTEVKGENKNLVLAKTLEPVLSEYDFILLDTPPALGELTINAISASDYAVVMMDGSKFCLDAIHKFIEICAASKENGNPDLEVAGILFSIVDPRVVDTKVMVQVMDEDYPGYRFETTIHRKAATKRLAIYGFENNPELKKGVGEYMLFVEELKNRVKATRYIQQG